MKKRVILRGLLGIPMGITIGYVFTIVISLIWAQGYYAPCAPGLTAVMGSEIGAVVVQTVLSGIVGAGFAAASVIWEIGEWSITRQTVSCFIIYGVIMFPLAYLANWMQHTVAGVLSYVAIFVVVFAAIWLVFRFIWKGKVKKLDSEVKKRRLEEEK